MTKEDKLNQLKTLFKKQKDERQQRCEQNRMKSTQRWSTKNTAEPAKRQPQPSSKIETKATQSSVSDLHEFLERINLLQHQQKLVEAGADSLQILREMKKQHLEEIEIPKGHIVKILKYLNVGQQPTTSSEVAKAPEQSGFTKKTQVEVGTPQNKPLGVSLEECQTDGPISIRQFCEQCYKPYYSSPSSNYEPFCSQTCQNRYRKENYVLCSTCKAHFERWNCFKHEDSYYCSEACIQPVLVALQQSQAVSNSQVTKDSAPSAEGMEEEPFFLLEEARVEEDLPINLNEFLEIQRELKDNQ